MDGMGMLDSVIRLFLDKPLAQGIGVVALVVGIGAFMQHSDRRLKQRLTLFQVAIGSHFWLMGSPVAAFSVWLSACRTVASGYSRSPWLMVGFLLLVWGLGGPRVTMAVQWLPLIGTSIATWGLFRERGIRLRLSLLSGALCWVTHNFLIGSIGGTLIEASFLVVNSHTIYRMWRGAEPAPAS